MNRATIERAVGALIGSVVGDALGAPFEFGPADAFGHRFPDQLLLDPSEMVGGGQWEPAEWTDDTQMALLVAESLLDRSGLDQAHLFGRFVKWCRSSPKDVGVQTRSVLTSGRPWQAAPAEHFAGAGKGAGNGSLMRALPGALYFAAADRSMSCDAARRISALTHGDPAAGEGCVVYHELVRVALEGGDPVGAIDSALALVKAEHRDKWAPYVTSGYDPRRDPMSNGAVWPALGAAVWALRTTSTFGDAVRAAIDLGNDTDTVACITGGLAGAVYSIAAIPSRWTTYLHGQLVGRADSGFGLAELEALARNLLNGHRAPSTPPPPEHTVEPQRVDDDVPLFAASFPGVAAALKGGRLPKGALVISLSRTDAAVAAYRPHRQVWMLDQDTPGANMAIDTVLDDVVATIDAALTARQPVVVHCHGGRSRTGLVLRAWLLARNPGLSVEQATAEMHRRWPHLDTWNPSFTAALTRWADRGARPAVGPAPSMSVPKPKPEPSRPGPQSARTTTGAANWTMRFDRRISAALLDALDAEGWLHPLVARRTAEPTLLDLQGRRAGNGQRCWVSLYAGLSSVLDVDEDKGRFRLRTHPSYQRVGSFDPSWSSWQSPEELARQWAQVDGYLDRVLADTEILPRYLSREGQVHPLLCAGFSRDYRIIQREAVIAFPDAAKRQAAVQVIESSIHQAITSAGHAEPWWPGLRDQGKFPSLGIEADLLGIDPNGRLLVIEAKPAPELKGIAWAPAQVALYAQLFSRLLATEPDAAALLDEMLAQRVVLGLTAPGNYLAQPVRVAPIVAIGPGPLPSAALDRLAAVASAICDAVRNETVDPLEVWLLDSHGGIERRWFPQGERRSALTSAAAVTTVTARAGSFVAAARAAATAWKQRTPTLPPLARDRAPYRGVGPAYPFCLPITYSTLNLLPDARSTALERFQAAGINGTMASRAAHRTTCCRRRSSAPTPSPPSSIGQTSSPGCSGEPFP